LTLFLLGGGMMMEEIDRLKIASAIAKLNAVPFRNILNYYRIPITEKRDKFFVHCPFHEEKSASFCVGGKDNFAYCFGCARSWDGIQFIRDMEKCGYFEALKRLAEIGKVEVSIEDLKMFAKKYRIIWKRFGGDKVQVENMEMKKRWMLVDKVSWEFTRFYQEQENWSVFWSYIELCWKNFADIVDFGEMDSAKVDKVKDWLKESKKFLLQSVKYWKLYSSFVEEFYREQVDGI
jgi:hypothetical protein